MFLWLLHALARMGTGIFFILTGWNQVQDLIRSKDLLNFFWIPVPAAHRWDPFFPLMELAAGIILLIGWQTRVLTVLLLMILISSLILPAFNTLSGLSLFPVQAFAVTGLLVGLCVTGSGFYSFDHFWRRYVTGRVVTKIGCPGV